MYINAKGLTGYRRGLGQTSGDSVDLSTLYPPAFPDTGTITDVAPSMCADGSPVPASGVCASAASSTGITAMLNANAGKLAIGAGVFLAVMLFAKAGR